LTTRLDVKQITKAPKALLHDHLDGGLRPSTVIDIAGRIGYDGLPATDVDELAKWFRTQSHSGSLERYLEPFSHTVAVMQTADSLHRVAYECVEDLAADSVVYAEIRFAPELHIDHGLSFDEIVDAVLAGFADGENACAAAGRPIVVRLLVTAMRHAAVSREIAELAVRWRDKGVVGFDIAGAEAGNPPTRHLDAFEYMRDNNARFTIHAGEAFGLPSIHEAIAFCGADRLGHGVRIVDDIDVLERGVEGGGAEIQDHVFYQDRCAQIQYDVQDLHWGHGGFLLDRVSPTGNSTGDIRQLPQRGGHQPHEDPVRHRADRQKFPQ